MSLSFPLPYLFFIAASLFFVGAYGLFFYFYSPKKTTPKNILLGALLFGAASALLAALFERLFIQSFNIDLPFLAGGFKILHAKDIIAPLLFSFFFVAVIEEIVKLIVLENYLKLKAANQVIDGMKIGVWLGLGFAFVENFIYFSNFSSQVPSIFGSAFLSFILLRGIFATLAQVIYGVIMGYFLTLAKFNRLFQFYFVKRALIVCLIAHGFFNFFLIIGWPFYSLIILVLLSGAVLFWYNSRKNLESFYQRKVFIIPQFLPERRELEALSAKENAPDTFFRQLLKKFPPQEIKKDKKKKR